MKHYLIPFLVVLCSLTLAGEQPSRDLETIQKCLLIVDTPQAKIDSLLSGSVMIWLHGNHWKPVDTLPKGTIFFISSSDYKTATITTLQNDLIVTREEIYNFNEAEHKKK